MTSWGLVYLFIPAFIVWIGADYELISHTCGAVQATCHHLFKIWQPSCHWHFQCTYEDASFINNILYMGTSLLNWWTPWKCWGWFVSSSNNCLQSHPHFMVSEDEVFIKRERKESGTTESGSWYLFVCLLVLSTVQLLSFNLKSSSSQNCVFFFSPCSPSGMFVLQLCRIMQSLIRWGCVHIHCLKGPFALCSL